MTKITKIPILIQEALFLSFYAGMWQGEAQLEESMDNNFFDAFMGVIYAEKTAMPLHTVSNGGDLNTRPVRYNLRSNDWRNGAFINAKKFKKEAEKCIIEYLNNLEIGKQ